MFGKLSKRPVAGTNHDKVPSLCRAAHRRFNKENMGANVEWIVDLDVSLEDAPALAERVKEWLLDREIISRTLCPERSYNDAELMNRGACAAQWDAYPTHSHTSMQGLEVHIGRQVFHTGDNGIQAICCPTCGAAHDPDEVPWSDAVGAWYLNEATHTMTCPACRASLSIVDWTFETPWGFGHLAFGFWNWNISDRLVDAVAALTGHRCRFVSEHI